MNINIAKEKIVNHNVKVKKTKIEKEIEIEKKTKEYMNKIKQLQSRIEKIIKIGNLCIENNIEIGQRGDKRTYKDNCFETEGIKHQLGFYRNHFQGYPTYKCNKYDYIGFQNGGFCGDYDFLTNGKEIIEIKQKRDHLTPPLDNTSIYREPTIYQMSHFIAEFDNFEKEFYNFINNL